MLLVVGLAGQRRPVAAGLGALLGNEKPAQHFPAYDSSETASGYGCPPILRSIAANQINSVQTRCIVKGEAQKSPRFWRFSGGF